uniref:Collagen-like protein n=1 Tax=Panagrellus redivivus TaxID=6233 RepID=A0A7E4VVH3_PANRE
MRRTGGIGRPLVGILVTYVVGIQGGPDFATTVASLLTTPAGSKPSTIINAVLLGIAIALFIATLGSLGGMIFCLAKFKKSKAPAKPGAPGKKGLLGSLGNGKQQPGGLPGAGGKPGPKPSLVKAATSTTSLKKPGGGPLKPAPTVPPTKITPKQAPKPKSTTPTASTTRSSSQPKRGPPSPQGHSPKDGSQKDLPPEPTQQSSRRIEIDDIATPNVVRKTFISYGNEQWREAGDTSAETEDFTFEIPSGNTFSMLDE